MEEPLDRKFGKRGAPFPGVIRRLLLKKRQTTPIGGGDVHQVIILFGPMGELFEQQARTHPTAFSRDRVVHQNDPASIEHTMHGVEVIKATANGVIPVDEREVESRARGAEFTLDGFR